MSAKNIANAEDRFEYRQLPLRLDLGLGKTFQAGNLLFQAAQHRQIALHSAGHMPVWQGTCDIVLCKLANAIRIERPRGQDGIKEQSSVGTST